LYHQSPRTPIINQPEVSQVSSTSSPNIAPWLAVSSAQQAVAYYAKAFRAVELYRLDGDTGTIAVAQLSIDGAVFWVQDDADYSPKAGATGAVRMILSVDDPDAVFAQAIAAGATSVAPMHEEYGCAPAA
jgi:PhnB protein